MSSNLALFTGICGFLAASLSYSPVRAGNEPDALPSLVQEAGAIRTPTRSQEEYDSQSPSPPGREIIGEKVILELREEYKRRMGEHYRLKNFNDNLLVYGDLPLKQIRRLMFN